MKLFYATGIHGSEVCWRKLLNVGDFYDVDVVILGGGVIGRGVAFLVNQGKGRWKTRLNGESLVVHEGAELDFAEQRIRNAGLYIHRTTPDEAASLVKNPHQCEALYEKLATESLRRWLALAETRLSGQRRFVAIPGNDDPLFIDAMFEECPVVEWVQRSVVDLDGTHSLVSEGWMRPTPQKTPREMEEDDLYEVLEGLVQQVGDVYMAVFNLHAPPFGSRLDDTPSAVEIGRLLEPTGSRAVRRLIETYQPLLGLHGHAHQSRGSMPIGRTLCLNPGSSSQEGILQGYLVVLGERGVEAYQTVQG